MYLSIENLPHDVVVTRPLNRLRLGKTQEGPQYAADKGSLPQSLDDLVEFGYLREIPVDPFTEQRDWVQVVGDDPNLPGGGARIIDVHSASLATSPAGTPYKKW